MNRKKLIALACGEVLLLAAVFSAITFSLNDPTTQLSLATRALRSAQNIDPAAAPLDSLGLGTAFCSGFSDDRQYLYQLNTVITTKPDGTKTFVTQRTGDNKTLRQFFADEKFFTDRSNGAIQTTYDIVSQCGGVDIVYTVRNTTGTSQVLPRFEIDGISQSTTGDLYVLDTKDAGYVRKVGPVIQGGDRNGQQLTMLYGGGCCDYPSFYYSPVMVTYDADAAAGTALLYPYMQYQHSIVPQMTKVTSGLQTGTWKHEYRDFKTEVSAANPTAQDAKLGPNQTRTYTVTLRFTQPRSWLLTLAPYKTYFKQTYGNVDQVRPQNLAPVEANIMGQEAYYNANTNPRAYSNPQSIANGWQPYINQYISGMRSRDLTRTMIWAPSGFYAPTSGACRICNYPSHFMSFLPILESTAGEFSKFAQNNMELGFWWGNSTYIPVPDQWNPTSNRRADFSNTSDRAFMDNQLTLAYQRGAKTIGLDAFDGTTYDRSFWIDHMKDLTRNQIQFVMETSGPDILHRKIANFYHPTSYPWWWQYNKLTANGPDVLSRYINAGAEIWFQHDVVAPFGDESAYEQSYSWGYTPLIGQANSSSNFRVSNLDLEVLKCFDGLDNDRDGKADWPYDAGCSSAMDNDEANAGGGGGSSGVSEFGNVPDDGTDSGSGAGDTSGGGGGSRNSTRESLLRRIQELQALLAALQAQLSGGMGAGAGTGSGAAVGNITQNLTIGSKGPDVVLLQQYLVSKGVLTMPAGAAFGTFGPITKFALAKFQQQNGISPAVGFFGPVTRAKIKMLP